MESPPATPSSQPPGNQFGKYTLVARLATGGMAEIFLARMHGAAGFEKLVCIKRILPHLARDRQFVSMFLAEARIAARISHPNVCQVFELGEIEGSYYIAMEYLEGVPLACFRRDDYYGAPPDPRLVAGIVIQACEGLHHAHQLRNSDGSVMEVVHRDISPQNLFVTSDGIVKVLDFGIAKIQGGAVRTSTGAIKGTYAYMAPEQLRGERVDRRTDVFALGIVMWETLTRRHLFRRDTEFLTFQAITAEPIEDVRAVRPDVPPALSSVIITALARDREQRYPTARMLGEAIVAAVSPLSGAVISEELQRAFPQELAEQADLIRVARDGGTFDLDVERGPSVGHGADLLTTPVSNQHALAMMVSSQSSAPHAIAAPSTGPITGPQPSAPLPNLGAQLPSGPHRIAGAASPSSVIATPPVSSVMPAAVPVLRRSLRPLLIAALALGVGGGAAVIYARVTRAPARAIADDPAPAAAPVAAAPTPAPAAAAQPPAPAPEPAAAPTAPTEAEPPAETAATPPAATEPPPNAAPAAKSDKRTVSATRSPSSPAAAKPSGPPGFITIDSSPVYAVIYIDGKNFGETPLVRIELPPGRHVVHAVAPSGATRDVRITVESGKVAPAARIVW
jgi:serine/threonine-protein kinase